MGSSFDVQVHQSSRASSRSSGGSSHGTYGGSSSGGTPRSTTPGVYRDYDAAKHSVTVTQAGGSTVFNHGKRDYDPGYGSPSYTGTYTR